MQGSASIVAKAVAALQKGLVNKIILSRPAVEVGEKLGFLPGDLNDKVALLDIITKEKS